MRLITRRIWRAFPELDRFNDEQCERFVVAANAALLLRVVRWILVCLACLIAFSTPWLVVMVEDLVVRLRGTWDTPIADWLSRSRWLNSYLGLGATLLALFVWSALWGFVTRDLLLRLRVRRVLRVRGVCFNCHYPLAGLPVVNLKVTCPECAHLTEVDVSLGELAPGADGTQRFAPSDRVIAESDPQRLPRLVWKLTKWTAAVLLVILLGTAMAFGLYEINLHRQAKQAARMPDALTALKQKRQQFGLPVDADAESFRMLGNLNAEVSAAESRLWPKGRPVAIEGFSHEVYLDASLLKPLTPEDPEIAPLNNAVREQSGKMVEELHRTGFYNRLLSIAIFTNGHAPDNLAPGDPMMTIDRTYLAQLRGASRWAVGLAIAGHERSDPDMVEQGLRIGLGFARMAERDCFQISHLTAYAIDAMTYRAARHILMSDPPLSILDAVNRAFATAEKPAPYWQAIEMERASAIDLTRWIFVDPSHSRWGRYNPSLRAFSISRDTPGRIGTLAENVSALNTLYDAHVASAKLPRHTRPRPPQPDTGLLIVDQLVSTTYAMRYADQIELERTAMPLMLAIERYRLTHGAYPPTLNALVPSIIPAVPQDPWAGRPFCYKLIDPATDKYKRGYLLYSVGRDGRDDGGNAPTYMVDALNNTTLANVDYIINHPER